MVVKVSSTIRLCYKRKGMLMIFAPFVYTNEFAKKSSVGFSFYRNFRLNNSLELDGVIFVK